MGIRLTDEEIETVGQMAAWQTPTQNSEEALMRFGRYVAAKAAVKAVWEIERRLAEFSICRRSGAIHKYWKIDGTDWQAIKHEVGLPWES